VKFYRIAFAYFCAIIIGIKDTMHLSQFFHGRKYAISFGGIMARPEPKHRTFMSSIADLLKKFAMFLSGSRPFLGYMAEILEHHAEKVQKRLLTLATAYLIITAGIIFFILGIMFLVIDLAGVQRGLVFAAVGALTVLISMLFIVIKKR
jgi:hypothetical protein